MTVLFVFAINIAGEESLPVDPIVPRPLAWITMAAAVMLLSWLNRDTLVMLFGINPGVGFNNALWNNRQLDVYLQIFLIFSGVLAVLGLLAEIHPSTQMTAHAGEEKG